jgi:hypothetical protein
MTTTADFIREMRTLCERATPGPWNSELVPNSLSETLYMVHSFVEAGHDTVCGSYKGHDHPDMQFIAAARTALPELLDMVEALEKDLAAETTRREEVEADNARLREALEFYARDGWTGPCAYPFIPWIMEDKGAKARDALNHKPKE